MLTLAFGMMVSELVRDAAPNGVLVERDGGGRVALEHEPVAARIPAQVDGGEAVFVNVDGARRQVSKGPFRRKSDAEDWLKAELSELPLHARDVAVLVLRGERVESRHRVAYVIADRSGERARLLCRPMPAVLVPSGETGAPRVDA